MDLLDSATRHEAFAALTRWHHDVARDALVREFEFEDFAQAFAFMTRIALAAERRDHHPDWSNTFNRVIVAWTSHDVKGLSRRDVEMAHATDAAYALCAREPAR